LAQLSKLIARRSSSKNTNMRYGQADLEAE